jgi:hypothetical protein
LEFVDDGRQDKSCHDLKFEWICKMFTSVVMGPTGQRPSLTFRKEFS